MSQGAPPAKKDRREKGTGSRTWDKVKERWRVRFPLGEGRTVTSYWRTEREADRELRRLAAEHQAGRLVESRLTLREWVVEWLADVVLPAKAKRTYEEYQSKLDRHVLPTLGDVRLSKLAARDIRALYSRLARAPKEGGAGLSPNTVRTIHAILHACLKQAMVDRHVGQNVCDVAAAPRAVEFEARPLGDEDLGRVLDAIDGHLHGPFWRFLIYTGARFGQAAGLRRAYVVEDRHQVRLWWNLARVPIELRDDPHVWWEFKEPKRAASRMTMPLSLPGLGAIRDQWDEIDRLRALAGDRWQELGLVFPDDDGRPLREGLVLRRWKAVLKRAKLPEKTRMHDLRHSAAGLALDNGAELIDVSRLLGHANSAITDKIYAGRLAKSTRRAADHVANAIVRPSRPAPNDVTEVT